MKNFLFILSLFLSSTALAGPGDFDPSFDGDGIVETAFPGLVSFVDRVAVQDNGKIIAAGYAGDATFTDASFALARYNSDGSLDSGFGDDGLILFSVSDGNDIVISDLELLLADGNKILIAGESGDFTDSEIVLARFNNDGAPDDSFGVEGRMTIPIPGTIETASGIGIRDDGKIIVVGGITPDVTGDEDLLLLRLNEDGSLDASFSDDGILAISVGDGALFNIDLVLQDNEKIVAFANGSVTGGASVFRFNADGSFDTSFDGDGVQPVPTDINPRSLGLQTDGQILVGGEDANDDFAVVRYHPDGSLDTTFDGDGIATAALADATSGVFSFAFQEDGKILAGGASFDGVDADGVIVRFLPDGSLDTSFGGTGIVFVDLSATGDQQIFSIALQEDGMILVNAVVNDNFALVRLEGDPTPEGGGCQLIR